MQNIKLTECPRDAMQGIKQFIPTEVKASYLNALLKVGFDMLDFGSFVSPKAIPQMQDTKEVIPLLELDNTSTKLLAIVANERGATEAVQFDEVSFIGYPFSISPTFLKRNINSTIDEAFSTTMGLKKISEKARKELVVYISMAFGNPYNDDWNAEILIRWVEKLHRSGIQLISLADTVGIASGNTLGKCYGTCKQEFPGVEFGLHLHSKLDGVKDKLFASYKNGCRRFDSVLDGLGGCPMAGTDLVGNIDTHSLIEFFSEIKEVLNLDMNALKNAKLKAPGYF